MELVYQIYAISKLIHDCYTIIMTKSEGGAPESIELKELPQFNPNTGLSFDYRNEYSFLIGYLDFLGIDEVRKVLDKLKEKSHTEYYTMKMYEERFRPDVYKDVITDQNREAVETIKKLAGDLNIMFRNPESMSKEALLAKCNELEKLIVGVKDG